MEMSIPIIPAYRSSNPNPDLGPRELMGLCKDRTSVEIKQIVHDYAGQQLEVSGLVYNVNTFGDALALIAIELDPAEPELVNASVAGKDKVARATTLRRGDKFKVSGKITNISRYSLDLTDCEFTRL